MASRVLDGLPRGIMHTNSDLELRPLWSTSSSRSKVLLSEFAGLLLYGSVFQFRRLAYLLMCLVCFIEI